MYTDLFLHKKGIKLFREYKPILQDYKGYEDYPKQDTKFVVGEHILDEKDYEEENIDYHQLKKFNMCIAIKDFEIPFSPPKPFLYLTHNEFHPTEFGHLPEGHRIIYNPFRREVQLKGNKVLNGKTDWIKVDRTKNFKDNSSDKDIIKSANNVMESLFPSGTFKTKKVFKIIPEITLGVSSFGEIVCMEKTIDAPRVGMAGESGNGKTWLGHRFKDECIDKDFAKIIEINDKKKENGDYAYEWEEKSKFRKELEKINQISKPMPMVFLYPVNDRLNKNHLLDKELCFHVSLPYKKMIQNLRVFSGFYDLGKSGDYFESIINDKEGNIIKNGGILSCKTLGQIKDYIDDHTITKENRKNGLQDLTIPHSSNSKLKTFFDKMKKSNILDVFNKVNPKWKIEFLDGNSFFTYPWIASLISGLSCSIETIHIIDEPYYYVELYFFLKNIFEEKKTNPYLKNETLIIFGDEIPDLMKDPNSFELIYDIARSGRSLGIGIFLATQYYKEIHDSIKTNLSHFFIFKQKINDPQLKSDLFSHYPEMYKKTRELKNKECIACGDFVLYNPITGERHSNDGVPIKMRLFPPNSKHCPPPQPNGR